MSDKQTQKTESIRITGTAKKALRQLAFYAGMTQQEAASAAIIYRWRQYEAENVNKRPSTQEPL